MFAAAVSGDVAAWLWEAYQFSPPLMLAILTVIVYFIRRDVKSLKEDARERTRRLDKHEILIDNNATAIEDVEEAANKNENRLIKLENWGGTKPDGKTADNGG
jgi:predicted Holliday junction resolvase-like endonuclease